MGWVMKKCSNCGWQGERSGQAKKCLECGSNSLETLPRCDFECGKYDEPVIILYNTTTKHKWVCHLSCLKQQLEVNEVLSENASSLGFEHEGAQVF